MELICDRGDTWEHMATCGADDPTLLGSIICFTVKKRQQDLDPAALIRVRSDDTANALSSLVINDASHFTIRLAPALTAQLPVGTWRFDVQVITPAGDVKTFADKGRGEFIVLGDIGRAVT
jgi:hypothetical protein